MSQAYNHFKWCLKKAEKEIAEREKIGKSPKHRGLLKITPDLEKAKKHIKKAEHNIEVAEYLTKGSFTDTSVASIFYSMYQCFLAISAKFGYDSRNQTCTIALIKYLNEEGKININDKFIGYFKYNDEESIIGMREDYTYGTDIKASKSKIEFFIEESKNLIDITKEIIYKK